MHMNAAINWRSRKAKVVPQSSTESETHAGVGACKDGRFVLHILKFVRAPVKGPTPLIIDNEGMWFNIRNDGVSQRTRYWELWLHLCREMYQRGLIGPHKCDTDDERADIFTKALVHGIGNFEFFRNDLMNI